MFFRLQASFGLFMLVLQLGLVSSSTIPVFYQQHDDLVLRQDMILSQRNITKNSHNPSSTTFTNTTTPTTTTFSSKKKSSTRFPASPPGATLVHFKPCSGSKGTIPLFVNRNYPISGSSSASTVWIVQHGSAANFNQYFTDLYNVVGDRGVLISPQFYPSSSKPTYSPEGVASNWYQPGKTLGWNNYDFDSGADAVAPAGTESCSSFDVYDALISSLRNRSKFPNVSRIVIVAHSAGANFAARYGMLTQDDGDIHYVVANHFSMPYFTSARPETPKYQAGCTGIQNWPNGWSGPLPRAVAARNPGAVSAFKRWIQKDVVLMTGTLDTYNRFHFGDQSCQVRAQGGQNRRDRGYAFWAYINILANTGVDVSAYFGYKNLLSSGARSLKGGKIPFNIRHCIVDNVGHKDADMFASDCGRAAIFGRRRIPPGPGPVRP